MLQTTELAEQIAKQTSVVPNIVFEIEGYDKIFGSATIKEYIKIGDPGLFIDGTWVIGGFRIMQNSSDYISFTSGGGSTTRITQQIAPDRSQGTSVSNMTVTLIDKNNEITQLISPGFELAEILARNCKVSIGFSESGYPKDYATIFRGVISGVDDGAGYVNFILSSTEEKKRTNIGELGTDKLTLAIDANPISSLQISDGTLWDVPYTSPDGVDTSVTYYAKIADEIFSYTGVSGNLLTGVARGQFGTTPVAQDLNTDVKKYYRFQGNGIDLALKLMLSGVNGPYMTGVKPTHFNTLDAFNSLQNAIYFDNTDITEDFGLTPGDYVSSSGAANAANNFTNKRIQLIGETETGMYIVLGDVNFVTENNTTAVLQFRSQYDTLGFGLGMSPTDVDIAEHQKLKLYFLGVFAYDFFIGGISSAKDFLDKQIYLPMACFSVPRKGRASVVLHRGPLAEDRIITLNADNVVNAKDIRVSRSLTSNFYNNVTFSIDYDRVTDKPNQVIPYDADPTSLSLISNVGAKTIPIQAQGIRANDDGIASTKRSANRLLSRYKRGAEYINNIKPLFGYSYLLEIGDLVVVDYASLQLGDFKTGTRSGDLRIMEVLNKVLDQKTGEVSLNLVNTVFDSTDRFGLISPASKIDDGSTTSQLRMQKSWSTAAWQNETTKWEVYGYEGQHVIVHDADWTNVAETTIISLAPDGITMYVDPPLPFTPLKGYIIQAPAYPSTANVNDEAFWKARHVMFSPQLKVTSGTSQTVFDVSSGDAAKVLVGAIFRVHNYDFSIDSPEVTVIDVTGTQITVDNPLGFTPDNLSLVDLVGFLDGGQAYRYI